MIRLLSVYYPVRTILLLVGEALIVGSSFVLGALWNAQSLSQLNDALFMRGGYLRILAITVVVLVLSHGFDLYDLSRVQVRLEQAFRILIVSGVVALALAGVIYYVPEFLPIRNSAFSGTIILVAALLSWRSGYSWLVRQPFFRERVYILGTGSRAERLRDGLKQVMGMEIVGWTGQCEEEVTREIAADHLLHLAYRERIHRVIVAMDNRRGILPVEELLALRLAGVKIEDATSSLEKVTGRIEVDHLYPSWFIFAQGFRFSAFNQILMRSLNLTAALVGLLLVLPLFPIIALIVKLGSPGPALYRQKRVGRGGRVFYCYKFRTMRENAEADSGPTWASDDDPRITPIGKLLRLSRLDEIPQLWCVLKGDMNFVGPRPERPEFVDWLTREIPYYGMRHVVRPGITGWAQVRYKYGNTLEDAREKLQHDLFYIKNSSISLDLLIWFQTLKIVTLGRGAK